MAKLTKADRGRCRCPQKDYFIWDDELPGFGLRVFASGKRSYLIQYRAAGRTRRYTIGLRMACGHQRQPGKKRRSNWGALRDNPSEGLTRPRAITVKGALCPLHRRSERRSHLGKGGRPKKPTTIVTDTGRIERASSADRRTPGQRSD